MRIYLHTYIQGYHPFARALYAWKGVKLRYSASGCCRMRAARVGVRRTVRVWTRVMRAKRRRGDDDDDDDTQSREMTKRWVVTGDLINKCATGRQVLYAAHRHTHTCIHARAHARGARGCFHVHRGRRGAFVCFLMRVAMKVDRYPVCNAFCSMNCENRLSCQ